MLLMVTGSGSALPKKFLRNFAPFESLLGEEAVKGLAEKKDLRLLEKSSAVFAVPHAANADGRQSAPVTFRLPGRKNFPIKNLLLLRLRWWLKLFAVGDDAFSLREPHRQQ